MLIADKSLTTREKILSSGEDLFSEFWYETVSIAQICRNAQLSNGIFYRYFTKKENLFKELLNKTLDIFKREIGKVSGKTQSQRLKSFLNIVVSIGKENTRLITIFREGQYRFPEFEKELEILYKNAIREIYNHPLTKAQYLFIMSGVRFISVRSLYNDTVINIKSIQKIIESGIFRETFSNPEKIFNNKHLHQQKMDLSSTKAKLMHSAIALFGERGFYNVDVYEISRNANLSVGSFYLYFESKDTCLKEIVAIIGNQTRHFISSNLPDNINRLEQEIAGISLFLTYFNQDSNYYRIVRESEFVIRDTVTEYYRRFEHGYLKNLKNLRIRDKSTSANFLMGLSHYLGIEVFFTGKIKKTKPLFQELAEYLQNGIQ